MKQADALGYVASEGGPLILLDVAHAADWSGIDGDDYGRACALLDEAHDGVIAVGASSGIVWDPGGAGAANVFRDGGRVVLVRWWAETEADASLLDIAASSERLLGKLELASSLLILWATENGANIRGLPTPSEGSVHGDLSVGHAGLVVRCEPGTYQVTCDTFSDGRGHGRRCWIAEI